MANKIMDNIAEEVMENVETYEPMAGNTSIVWRVLGTLAKAAAGYGIGKGIEKLVERGKAKRAAKIEVPEDITQDKIDEIPE